MKNLLLLLLFFFIACSCTFRCYEVRFNYYVGNNGINEIEWKDHEKYKEKVVKTEEETNQIQIPKGSGNLIIHIEAKVPKHIETAAEAQFTPLQNSLIGR
jgi:hypothetical protein